MLYSKFKDISNIDTVDKHIEIKLLMGCEF